MPPWSTGCSASASGRTRPTGSTIGPCESLRHRGHRFRRRSPGACPPGPRRPRVVYVSSIAAAGPSRPGQPIDERRPPAPVTDYGRSKLAGELVVRTGGVPWTTVRPPVVYGEWDRELLKVFEAARRGVAPVFRDGSQELSVIYAGDLARGLIAAGVTAAAV